MTFNATTSKDPKSWGPHAWHTLHRFAVQADQDKDEDFTVFVNHFARLLPCESCKEDFALIIKKLPPNRPYFEWSVSVHNEVNAKLNIPEMPLSTASLLWKDDLCVNCDKNKPRSNSILSAVAIIVILLLWYLLVKFRFL